MIKKQRSISVNLASYPHIKSGKQTVFADNCWNDSDINYCDYNFGYKIKLKGEKLLVKRTCKPSQMHLLSNRSEEFLAEWLQFCSATVVQIDSNIELEKLNMWANQCRKFGMAAFLRLSQPRLYKHSNINKLGSYIKRWFDFFTALILLIVFAPMFLAMGLFIRVYFNEPILQTQWCVGKQGKLFRIYEFGGNLTRMNLESLNKLPQLFNVLKGDMSIFGRFPRSLAAARNMSLSEQYDFNVLPGIIFPRVDKNNRRCKL